MPAEFSQEPEVLGVVNLLLHHSGLEVALVGGLPDTLRLGVSQRFQCWAEYKSGPPDERDLGAATVAALTEF
jgi:hypothetical protein